MIVPVNRFKAALADPHPRFGLWLSLASPFAAGVCATAPLDWLLVDGEHGPNTLRDVLAQLWAVGEAGPAVVVRSGDDRRRSIEPLLDAGVQTVMVPQVDTPDQAVRVAALFDYPPRGTRGIAVGSIRASRWGAVDDYLGQARRQLCLVAQIESARAVDNLAAIAAVPGIDALFVGPNDLAASLGRVGEVVHPAVQDAIAAVAAGGRAAGVPLGILAADRAAAWRYAGLGYRFIAIGSDAGLLARAVRDAAAGVRRPDPA